MSKYTTEVRYICEVKAGLTESKGYNSIDSILTTAAPRIFNFDFPIYDESFRLTFEKMILRHFYTREIGYETVGLWQLKLWDKLNLIMPYYNKMYESTLLQFNPLYDTDYTVEHEGEGSGTSTDSEEITDSRERDTIVDETIDRDIDISDATHRDIDIDDTNSNTNWNLFSDTPQGGINGITADNDSVANNTYLTDARKITDAGTYTRDEEDNETYTRDEHDDIDTHRTENMEEQGSTERSRTGSVTNMDSYTDRVFGKRGGMTYAKMIKEFRESFLRIDEMICRELEPLFLGLW